MSVDGVSEEGCVHTCVFPLSLSLSISVVSKLISQQSQISTVQGLKFLLGAKFFKLINYIGRYIVINLIRILLSWPLLKT